MCNNFDSKTLYEIFRACRLCGAGSGYKMPIVPNVVGFDCVGDVELRQKIRDCVQIEVSQTDAMPPLICELCVDKVNDFYEFIAMCRDTNAKTRQRLGLPQTHAHNISDNCILGVTEPVYAQDDDDEPLSRRSTTRRQQQNSPRESRSSRLDSSSSRSSRNRSSPTPVRGTRQSAADKDVSLSRLKDQLKKSDTLKPKIILKKEKAEVISIDSDDDDASLFPSIAKRSRDGTDKDSQDTPNKKIKLTIKLPQPTTAPKARPGPKCSKRADSPPPTKSKETPRPGPKSSKTIPGPQSSKRTSSPAPGPKSKRISSPAPGPKSSTRSSSPPSSPLSKRSLSPLASRSKRTSSPVPKSKRNSSPAPKSNRSSSPVPKSKRNSSPAPKSSRSSLPGPKSKRNSSPAPKSTRSSSPVPKSKRNTSPAPKSTRSSSPGPKSRRTLSSIPGPKSRTQRESPAPGPKTSKRSSSPPKPTPSPDFSCKICASVLNTPNGYANHIRIHRVKFTPNDLACNPCGEWFTSAEETTAHHKQHKNRNRPYKCRGCKTNYRTYSDYNKHMSETNCVPWVEAPDVKCDECWREFPTAPILDNHRCGGKEARPGGKCSNCSRTYQTLKSLKKHESTCTIKKKASDPWSEVKVAPSVRSRLRNAQVRIARVDQLLKRNRRHRYDVADVAHDLGVDRSCVYPYRSLVKIKQERLAFDGMVSIGKDVRDEFYTEEDYVHWDSDNSTSDEEYSLVTPQEKKKKVPSLTTLSLKTIFSRRCLGKVPRKLRKVRSEKFDSFFNTEAEFDVQDDINNIINNLGDENDDKKDNGFSLDNIKLTDVKSISDMPMDNDSASIDISDVFRETIESDSLLESNKIVSSEEKVDSLNTGEITNENEITNEKNSFNDISINVNKGNDNGSETDASLDDKAETLSTKQALDENDTASENSQDAMKTTVSDTIQNGNSLESAFTSIDKHGDTENQLESAVTSIGDTENQLEYADTSIDKNGDTENQLESAVTSIDKNGDTENQLESAVTSIDKNGDTENQLESAVTSIDKNGDTENQLESAVTSIDKNGDTENQSNLIDEISALYDKKLMEELDAEIGARDSNMSDKNDKILLEDLVPAKNDLKLVGLDAISDEEFNFDA